MNEERMWNLGTALALVKPLFDLSRQCGPLCIAVDSCERHRIHHLSLRNLGWYDLEELLKNNLVICIVSRPKLVQTEVVYGKRDVLDFRSPFFVFCWLFLDALFSNVRACFMILFVHIQTLPTARTRLSAIWSCALQKNWWFAFHCLYCAQSCCVNLVDTASRSSVRLRWMSSILVVAEPEQRRYPMRWRLTHGAACPESRSRWYAQRC